MAEPVRKGRSATRSRRTRASSTAVPPGLLGLQATAGNAAVTALVQRKLRVGAADDPLEREADTVARRVVADLQRGGPRGDAAAPMVTSAPSGVSRRHACDTGCSHGAGAVGAEGGSVPGDVARTIQRSRGGGRPLPGGLQRRMSDSFGTDLSSVRVHTTPTSDAANQSLGSQAFTTGSDIHFAAGSYDPGSRSGQELLAHELTHVVQQRGAPLVQRKRKTRDDATYTDDDVITRWVRFSTLFGFRRSTELRAIDAAVATYQGSGMTMGGNLPANINELGAIMHAIQAWRDSKTDVDDSRRLAVINRLDGIVAPRLAAKLQRQAQKQQDAALAAQRHGQAHKMDARMTSFAKRNVVDVNTDKFLPDNMKVGGIYDALTNRNADGTMSDEGVRLLEALGASDAAKYRQVGTSNAPTIDGRATTAGITREHAAGPKNTRSNRTLAPEVDNLVAGGPTAATINEKSVVLQGATVIYDTTDVHAAERRTAVGDALRAVAAEGVALPPGITIYLPKFARKVTVDANCKVKVDKRGIPDAVFTAPSTVVMNSGNTGNPKTDEMNGEFRFLSTSLGDAASAMTRSFVHELGHAAHYHNDKRRFFDLSVASFVRTADGRAGFDKAAVANAVSSYGADNPREMVAEMFLGAIYGKVFPDVLWEAYKAFGGAPLRSVAKSQ